MPRLRTLHPSFFSNERLLALPPLHRLLYAGLWCWADREGRLEDRPARLKLQILPGDDCDVNAMLDDLAVVPPNDHPFIIRYEVRGRRYIAIARFSARQQPHVREKVSLIPPPPPGLLKNDASPRKNRVKKPGASTVPAPGSAPPGPGSAPPVFCLRSSVFGLRSSGEVVVPPTEHAASTRPHQLALPGAHLSVVPSPPVPVAPTPPQAPAPSSPPSSPTVAAMAFFDAVLKVREAEYGQVLPESPPPDYLTRYAEAVAEIGKHFGVGREGAEGMLLSAYRRFAGTPFAKSLTPPGTTKVFFGKGKYGTAEPQWRKFLPVAGIAQDTSAAEALREVWNSIAEDGRLDRWVTPTAEEAQLAAEALQRRPLEAWRPLFWRVAASDFLCGGGPKRLRTRPAKVLSAGFDEKLLNGEWDNPGEDVSKRFQEKCVVGACHREARMGWAEEGTGALVADTALCMRHHGAFERAMGVGWRPESLEELAHAVARWQEESSGDGEGARALLPPADAGGERQRAEGALAR